MTTAQKIEVDLLTQFIHNATETQKHFREEFWGESDDDTYKMKRYTLVSRGSRLAMPDRLCTINGDNITKLAEDLTNAYTALFAPLIGAARQRIIEILNSK